MREKLKESRKFNLIVSYIPCFLLFSIFLFIYLVYGIVLI